MASVNPAFWSRKKVFVTGQTGFKGSWLSLWLQSMGAQVFGLALAPPTSPALFDEANVSQGMESIIGDVRDYATVLRALSSAQPEILIHMAAQPLVRHSYKAPIETYATNVMGTLHILEAARHVGSIRAIVNVTTDKCYENREWVWGYREDEAMGGFDPYSSSKGCSELVTGAYRRSFFKGGKVALASARAGNVIGGGDWANDRLVPDILNAFDKNEKVTIRNPMAIRPWQHVLEPLSGYLLLGERLYEEGHAYAQGWNFGPRDEDSRSVQWIVERLSKACNGKIDWVLEGHEQPHEATSLKLDISKARTLLGWEPRWSLETALDEIIEWHLAWRQGQDVRQKCINQIKKYQIITTPQSEKI